MSRPLVTATMLEELRRAGREIRLTKGALLTPAARDWLKEQAVPVSWEEPAGTAGGLAAVMDTTLPEMRAMRTMLERDGTLAEVIEPAPGAGGLVLAMRQLCGLISRQQAAKGVVFVRDGAVPVCVANKHQRIRAALGINVPMVEEACRSLGINVLVIEYTAQTTYQMKQMVARLVAGPASASPETAATIAAIEQGGGRADR